MTNPEWAQRCLERAAEGVASAGKGERHDTLKRKAVSIAPYVRDGALTAAQVHATLGQAAEATGKAPSEVRRVIEWGLDHGAELEASYPAEPYSPKTAMQWGAKVLQMPRRGPAAAGSDLLTCEPSGEPMTIYAFGGARATAGEALNWTWFELEANVAQPEPWPEDGKNGLGLWSPASFRDGSRARGSVVESLSCIALDYDDDPDFSVEQVRRWWGEVRHITHTSASHMVEKPPAGGAIPRGRVILALSRPVSWEEHERLAEWVIASGRGKVGATELRSRGRCYYLPAAAPGGYDWGGHDPGQVIDVDAMLESLEGGQSDPETAQPVVVKVPGPRGWFLRQPGGYSHVDGSLLQAEMARHHADDCNVWIEGKHGPRPMKAEEIWSQFGVRADSLVYSMLADRSGFENDPHTNGGTLTLAVCRRDSRLAACFHQDVDDWLVQMVQEPDRLRDWLACSLNVALPTAALYLQGSDSVGKGMLATALARVFGRDVVSYADVIGGFNGALKDCPIVYLDERAPKTSNGSAAFRTLVGDSSRALTQKHMPAATLIGCPRLIVAANNSDALRLGSESLERADEEAIALRIVHLQVRAECKAWLKSKGGRAFTHDWVELRDGSPGKVAQHIAWLAEHWDVTKPGSRFLVEGDASAWLRSVGLREGLPRRVLVAIAESLSGGEADLEPDGQAVYPDPPNRRVYVRTGNLVKRWSELTGENRPPSADALGKALGRLDPTKRVKIPMGLHSRRPWAKPVPFDAVVSVAEELGIGDIDVIRHSLGLEPEEC